MFEPGTRLIATRTLPGGRTVTLTGTVVEDYGYGLLWRDATTGNRVHLCTDPKRLAESGITQTLTAA